MAFGPYGARSRQRSRIAGGRIRRQLLGSIQLPPVALGLPLRPALEVYTEMEVIGFP